MKNKKRIDNQSQINPIVLTLFEAYLKQDNVEVEFRPIEVFAGRQFPDYIGTIRVRENHAVILEIELTEEDLKLIKNPFFIGPHFEVWRRQHKHERFTYVSR